MRVNQPMNRTSRQVQQPKQTMQQPKPTMQQPSSNPALPRPNEHKETEVMMLARKIKKEQGALTAGYFLYAIKPFVAPNEISFIERELQIKCECDPKMRKTQQSNTGSSPMLQVLMNMMRGGKADPAALMKMMKAK